MKKTISFFIAFAMLFSVYVVSVSATTVDTSTGPSDIEAQVMSEVEKAFDKLASEYQQKTDVVFDDFYYMDIWDYYCHFVDESTINYVYVQWSGSIGSDAIVGDRYLDYCIRSPQILGPTIGLYIYDVENEKIYTFREAEFYARGYLQDFLDNHRAEITPYYDFYICGDVDFDDELTVLDATKIQRFHARLVGFPYKEAFSGYEKGMIYVSDVDGDGSRSVMDATAIQLKLAKL